RVVRQPLTGGDRRPAPGLVVECAVDGRRGGDAIRGQLRARARRWSCLIILRARRDGERDDGQRKDEVGRVPRRHNHTMRIRRARSSVRLCRAWPRPCDKRFSWRWKALYGVTEGGGSLDEEYAVDGPARRLVQAVAGQHVVVLGPREPRLETQGRCDRQRRA